MSKMLPDAEPVQAAPPVQTALPVQAAPAVQAAPWVDRRADIESPPIDSRWVDIVQVAPPIISKPEPMVTPRGVVMVVMIVIVVLTLVVVTLDERPRYPRY